MGGILVRINGLLSHTVCELFGIFIMRHQDCIVIGGGVVGMATARELALCGMKVAVFDQGRLGMEASWAAGGILSSMRPWAEEPYSSSLSMTAHDRYPDFSAALQRESGIDPQYDRCGMLLIDQDDVIASKKWLAKNKLSFTESYSALPPTMCIPNDVIFIPAIAQIRVTRLIKALHASLRKLKVVILENTAISGLDSAAHSCRFVQAGGTRYYADHFVVTAGAWSQRLLGDMQTDVEIEPVLGQILCVKFPERRLATMLLDGSHYLIPRNDGHVLIGSTVEHVGFNKKTTTRARDHLMQWACALWPDIVAAIFVQQWAGLRPGTNNGKPYLGKLKNRSNVYLNTGHYRKGILQAPVCAEKIADMICR